MKVVALPFVPPDALLAQYQRARAYTDAYVINVPGRVELADYVPAFYTTWLFRAERLVLTLLVGKGSTDAQAMDLAMGSADRFAAWSVEARKSDQILMCDYLSKTRSWLMCEPNGAEGTRLYFGSAIVPQRITSNGQVYLGLGFHILLPFHKLYSRALLRAAGRRLRQDA